MPRTVGPDRPPAVVAAVPITASAVTAAAIPMSAAVSENRVGRRSESWQSEALDFAEAGPLRYATNWFANAGSKARLYPGRRKGDSIEEITEGPAVDAMAQLFGSSPAMLKAMCQQYFVTGEWYIVGRGADTGVDGETVIGEPDDVWEVVSVEELTYSAGKVWQLKVEENKTIELGTSDVVLRMWAPSIRKRWLADSPAKAALPDLREHALLSSSISAMTRSRLLGAGLLVVPSEMTFSKPANSSLPDVDSFMLALGSTMMAAMANPGSVEASVPIIVKAPGEYLKELQHLTFWTPMDEKIGEMRKDAVRNIATTIDLPAEVLLGTADMNHWSSWQMDESAVKVHVEPGLEVIAAAVASSYLQVVTKDKTLVVGVDTSGLRMRPNRSKEALELYDRGQLNAVSLRRETGFDESDAMKEPEYKQWLLRKVASGSATPEMVVEAIRLLINVELPSEADVNRQTRPDPSLVDHPQQGPPPDDDAHTASLVATCEVLVYRALERAGNRLKNRTTSRPEGVPADEVYLYVPCKTDALAALLAGAWDPLPTLLHRTSYDASRVSTALDSYTRSLLATQTKYDPDAMQRHLFTALRIGS